jgi:hypothetical protein
VATKFNLFRTYEQIIDEKDSGFFQKDHTIHQCFDWLVFKILRISIEMMVQVQGVELIQVVIWHVKWLLKLLMIYT